MSWIAEYDTQGREFPTCVHVTKTTGTMTHGATYVPIEDGKAVRAENAKLRELVMDMYHVIATLEEANDEAVVRGGVMLDMAYFAKRMRELGLEVE